MLKKQELSYPPKVVVFVNICFAAMALIGQVGQNVSLPLWTGATGALGNPNCTTSSASYSNNLESEVGLGFSGSSNASSYQPTMDPFFVLSFASLSFVVIFGLITLFLVCVQFLHNFSCGNQPVCWITKKDDLAFPQWQLILVGLFDALNGILVVFASLPARTAPFLQAVLGNFTIPFTIFFRLLLLRKRPTPIKLLAASIVFVGLIFSLIPVVFGFDKDSKEGEEEYFNQSRSSQVLWPLCFICGFIPAAIMNVIEEKSLKDTRKVNLFYFLFMTSIYQLLTVWLLFWTAILPHFGFVDSIKHFGLNYKFALQCFFGGAGCDYNPGLSGTMFIILYFISYVGGGLLIRYAEGATYLAIVQSLVTPLGALFWTVFSRDECAHFHVHPHAGSLTYFSIGGMIFMVPAIFLYNIGTWTALKNIFRCTAAEPGETRALLDNSSSTNKA